MQGGIEDNKYEVTWIIKDNEYYGRVVDKLSNN
jgi:hypothetical protein